MGFLCDVPLFYQFPSSWCFKCDQVNDIVYAKQYFILMLDLDWKL